MKNISCCVAVMLALFATPAVVANGDDAAKQSAALTAAQVIDRIKANVGVPWMAQTVDTFKAGDQRRRSPASRRR